MNAAVIVLYNPDYDRLKKNTDAIIGQVDKLIFVDNGKNEETFLHIKELTEQNNVVYINNNGNKGIAYALNRAVEYCLKNGYLWLLTLDQDSVCPENLISVYKKYISYKDIGIISCAINYNNIETVKAGGGDFAYVEQCITSASLINVNICRNLGGYDEDMFIDDVDYEYCYRLRKAGYKIIQTNEVILNHMLGDLKERKFLFIPIKISNHSAFRKYYIFRNKIYVHRKHPEWKREKEPSLIKEIVKIILYEKQKYVKIKKILEAVKDGKKMPIKEKDDYIRIS